MGELNTEVHSVPKIGTRRISLPLVAGEWVDVRSVDEILATLDKDGKLDGMPFMPEMLHHCGKTLRVFKRAHKTCDTAYQSGTRALEDAVHLEGSRCDGSAHGGCQAECMLFWKEAWLEPRGEAPTELVRSSASADAARPTGCSAAELRRATSSVGSAPSEAPRYSCQATNLLSATKPLRTWDVRQYVDDFRFGNVDATTFVKGALYRFSAYAVRRTHALGRNLTLSEHISQWLMRAYDALQARLPDGVPYPRRNGSIPKGQRTPPGDDVTRFRPGSLVRVKSYEEILQTLDTENRNRGLYFDAENVPYCGKELRVRSLVDHIINEQTGEMLHFKTPAIILEGAYCKGTYSDKRMFCPRAVYPYWRTAWLTLLEAPRSVQTELPERALSQPVPLSLS
jgi:hypothetical protein